MLEANGGVDWRLMEAHLQDSGYFVHTKVINAETFAPQSRQRVYIICINQHKLRHPEVFQWPEDGASSLAVADILEDLDEDAIRSHTLLER